jgi:hypothetical protein
MSHSTVFPRKRLPLRFPLAAVLPFMPAPANIAAQKERLYELRPLSPETLAKLEHVETTLVIEQASQSLASP